MDLNIPPPDTGSGLRGIEPELFASLLKHAGEVFGLGEGLLVHDYHAHRGLYALATRHPPGTLIAGTKDNEAIDVGYWAFGGGTSLASAHGLVNRYSEDIDIALIAPSTIGRTPLDRARRNLARVAADAITGSDRTRQDTSSAGTIATILANPEGPADPVRIDVSPQQPVPNIIQTLPVVSLLGRVADSRITRAHPELGGFEVPTLCVPVTAANKFDALHRLATQQRHDLVRGRGRDLYDLACIALSPTHAAAAHARIPALAALAGSVRRGRPVPRPVDGYANSPVFAEGSEAHLALRQGYDDTSNMIWGDTAPSFEEAVEAARSLDNTGSAARLTPHTELG